jgi:hypothetical protein
VTVGSTAYGSSTPVTGHEDVITFNPASADTGLPGWQETTVQFTSTGHSPATAVTVPATLKRLVQPVFSTMSVSKTSGISAAGEDVTVTVKTNVPAWWARQGTGSNVAGNAPTTGAVNRTATVAIPARAVSESASWSGSTTVYLYAGYAAFTNLGYNFDALATPLSTTVTQEKYTASISSYSPNKIPAGGATVTVNLNTDASALQAKYVVGGNTSSGTYTMSAAKTLSISLPSNSGAERTVTLVNALSPTTEIGTMTQLGPPGTGFYNGTTPCPSGSTIKKPTPNDNIIWYTDQSCGTVMNCVKRKAYLYPNTYYEVTIVNGVTTESYGQYTGVGHYFCLI